MASNVSNFEESRHYHVTADTPALERKQLQYLFSTETVSLLVVDCPFDGGSLNIYLFHWTDDIERELGTLPAHEEGVARIFDYSFEFEENHLQRLRDYFNNVCQSSKWIPMVTSGHADSLYDLDNIASQWTSDDPDWLKAEDHIPTLQDNGRDFKFLKCLPIERNRLLGKSIRAIPPTIDIRIN